MCDKYVKDRDGKADKHKQQFKYKLLLNAQARQLHTFVKDMYNLTVKQTEVSRWVIIPETLHKNTIHSMNDVTCSQFMNHMFTVNVKVWLFS